MLGIVEVPLGLNRSKGVQKRLAILPQAPRILIDQLFQSWASIPHTEQFVDLFLIFNHRVPSLSMIQNKLYFIGYGILVERNGYATDALHGHHGPVELRPVVAHDRHFVPALHAKGGEAAS